MRTFRFDIAGTTDNTQVQQQSISCELNLVPVADLNEEQADDCSCVTEADCIRNACSNGICEHRIGGPYFSMLDRKVFDPSDSNSVRSSVPFQRSLMDAGCGTFFNGEYYVLDREVSI